MNQTFSIPSDLFLLNHPFYQAWVEGRLTKSTLQDYVRQYYHHVEAFPQYLTNALDFCTEGKSRNLLSENLAEENGSQGGTPHPELWLQFAGGLGVPAPEVKSAAKRSGIRNVVETFNAFSKESLPHALGALYAYESQVPEIAETKIAGLRQHFSINDEDTLAFFEVHRTADVHHRNTLHKMIEDLSEPEKQQAHHAANASALALWDFLSDIYHENGCHCA